MKKNILIIDKTRLDEEWERQPELMFDFCKKLADASNVMDKVKSLLEVTKAELAVQARRDPKSYLKTKATESSISEYVNSHPKIKQLLNKLYIAKHRKELLAGMVSALEQRKSALERLVSLHGQSYFSEPRPVDQPSRETISEIQNKKANSKIKERLKNLK
jgi:hypothetical protein